MQQTVNEPRGLGGWLILVAIGLVWSTYNATTSFLEATQHFPLSPHMPFGIQAFIMTSMGMCLVMILSLLHLGWLMIFKDARFPKRYMVIMGAIAVYIPAETAAVYALFSHLGIPTDAIAQQLPRTILVSLATLFIWLPYMRRSRRVRNTFIYLPPKVLNAAKSAP